MVEYFQGTAGMVVALKPSSIKNMHYSHLSKKLRGLCEFF